MSFAPPLSASERALRGQADMHPAAKLASASMGWSAKLRQAEEAASVWRATSKLQVSAPPPSSSARSSVAPPRSGTSTPRRQSVATPRDSKEKASGRAPSRASSQSRLEGEGAAPTQDALTASQRSLPQGGAVWSAIQQAKAAVKPHISDERPRPPSSGRTTPRTSAPRPTSSGGPYSNKVAAPPVKGGPAGMSSRSGSAAAQFSAAEMATAQASALVEAGKCFKAERDALQRELAAVKEELRETAGRSARDLAAAKDESRSVSMEAVEAAKKCDSLSREVQEATQLAEEATQRAEAAERSAVGASSEAQDLGRQIVELAERCDAAESDKESLRTECDELRQSLAQAQAASGEEESLRTECDELRQTLEQCDELRRTLEQAQAPSGEESLRTECEELRQSLAQALARGGEEGALCASLAAAQSDRESLGASLAAAQSDKESLRTECDALRASLAAAQSNVEALQELKLHQEQQEEQLQQERRLREQQQEQLQQEQQLREQLQEQLEQEQFRLRQLQGQPQTPELSFSAVAACVSSPSAAEEELKRGLRLAEATAQGLRDEREQLRRQLDAVTEQLGHAAEIPVGTHEGTHEASVRVAKPPAAPRPAPRRRRLAALAALLLIGLAPAAHKVASGEPLGLPSRQDLEGALRRSGAGLEEGAVRLQGSLRSSAAALEGGLPEEIRGAARRALEGFPALHQLPGSAGRGSAA